MHLFLVGFPRAGKTTLGKKLSKIVESPFYDIDQMMEVKENKTIVQIYKSRGEDSFRQEEQKHLFSLREKKEGIVATGGGIVLNKKNREYLREQGLVVYLKLPKDLLIERLCKKPLSFCTSLLKNRESLYANVAHTILFLRQEQRDLTYLEILWKRWKGSLKD